MVIRLISVPGPFGDWSNSMRLFRSILATWTTSSYFTARSFRQFPPGHTIENFAGFPLAPAEKFLYVWFAMDLWEWDVPFSYAASRVVTLPLSGRPSRHAAGVLRRIPALPPDAETASEELLCRTRCCWKPAFRCWLPLVPSDRPQLDLLRTALQEGFRNLSQRLKGTSTAEPHCFQAVGSQRTAGGVDPAREVPPVNARLEIVCTGPDGSEKRRDVLAIERAELAMETSADSGRRKSAPARG